MLVAKLRRVVAGRGKVWLGRAPMNAARLAEDVDHASLRMFSAELGLLARRHTEARLPGALWEPAPGVGDVNHAFVGVVGATLARPCTGCAELGRLVAAWVDAPLVRKVDHACGSMLGTALLSLAALHSEVRPRGASHMFAGLVSPGTCLVAAV